MDFIICKPLCVNVYHNKMVQTVAGSSALHICPRTWSFVKAKKLELRWLRGKAFLERLSLLLSAVDVLQVLDFR